MPITISSVQILIESLFNKCKGNDSDFTFYKTCKTLQMALDEIQKSQ